MTPNLEILVAGRAHQGSRLDIEIPARHDTVGRRHVEITLGPDGSCHLVDLGSTNGTHVLEGGRWVRGQQKTVAASEPIRLGEFQTTVGELLGFRRVAHPAQPPPLPVTPPAPPPLPNAKPRRNPLTGEVESMP
jgi:pSer/pThr/pTyr-binding forkhead associated (FHA) protein